MERSAPRRTFGLAAALVASNAIVAGTLGSAVADTPEWGGIAYSESTGAFGFSFGNRTPDATRHRALRQCRQRASANDCRVGTTFANKCGGLTLLETTAKSSSGGRKVVRFFSVATAKTREAAEAASVAKCKSDHKKLNLSGDACRLITSICSNGR